MKIGIKATVNLKNHDLMMARIDKGYHNITEFVQFLNREGLSIAYNTYMLIEGLRSTPRASTIAKLCKILDRDPEELFPKLTKEVVQMSKNLKKSAYAVQDAKMLMSNQGEQVRLVSDDIKLRIANALHTLDERERKILELRYYEDLTLHEVGKKFHINAERVRQLEARAIRKLRHPSKVKIITEGV